MSPFGVPKNLYLIGTMNTADRSIQLLDTALRRRFDFVEMMPKPELISKKLIDAEVDCQEVLKAMNERITTLLDREHQIGHTYLLGVDTMEELSYAFQNKIFPLLQEYFFDDWSKIRAVLGQNGFVTTKRCSICLRTSNKRTKIEQFTSDYPATTPDGQTRRPTSRYTMLATRMIQVPADARHHTVREYEPLDFVTAQERFGRAKGRSKVYFKQNSNGTLTASNYVGVITTKRGTVIEILPKIDLGDEAEPDHEKTKRLFLPMLRCWRGFGEKIATESDIRTLRRFPMIEVFVRQFLANLHTLARSSLARRYIPMEENLPYLAWTPPLSRANPRELDQSGAVLRLRTTN